MIFTLRLPQFLISQGQWVTKHFLADLGPYLGVISQAVIEFSHIKCLHLLQQQKLKACFSGFYFSQDSKEAGDLYSVHYFLFGLMSSCTSMWDGSDSNMQHRVCVSVNPILNGRTHLVFSHHHLQQTRIRNAYNRQTAKASTNFLFKRTLRKKIENRHQDLNKG